MKIANNTGVWLVNRGQFRFQDPISGVMFEPGEVTKALRNDWVRSQPTIVRALDPTNEVTEEAQAELAALNAQDAEELAAAILKTEAVYAAANNGGLGVTEAQQLKVVDAAGAEVAAEPIPEPDPLSEYAVEEEEKKKKSK